MGKQVSTFSRTMPSPIPVVLTPAFSARPGWYSLGSQALWWIQSHPCKASAMIPCAETHLHKESEVSSIHHPFIIHSSSIHHPFQTCPNLQTHSSQNAPRFGLTCGHYMMIAAVMQILKKNVMHEPPIEFFDL